MTVGLVLDAGYIGVASPRGFGAKPAIKIVRKMRPLNCEWRETPLKLLRHSCQSFQTPQ